MNSFFNKILEFIRSLFENTAFWLTTLISSGIGLVSLFAEGITSLFHRVILPLFPNPFDLLPGEAARHLSYFSNLLALDVLLQEILQYIFVVLACMYSHVGALPIKVVKRYVLRDPH